MKTTLPIYVDFNRFCSGEKNRDLLASCDWQRNVRFLTASLRENRSRAARPGKTGRRR